MADSMKNRWYQIHLSTLVLALLLGGFWLGIDVLVWRDFVDASKSDQSYLAMETFTLAPVFSLQVLMVVCLVWLSERSILHHAQAPTQADTAKQDEKETPP